MTDQMSMINSMPQMGLPEGLTEERLDLTGTLAEGLGLNMNARICASLEAMGMGPAEIEIRTGLSMLFVMGCRNNLNYRELVRRCVEYQAKDKAKYDKPIDEIFNDQILPSVTTLIELRDNPYMKGGVRLKAAQTFLDRAPEAPKSTRNVEERSLKLTIPAQEALEMLRALKDSGSRDDLDLIELMEGKGFTTEGEDVDEFDDRTIAVTEIA